MSGEYLIDLLDHKRRVAGYMQLTANELFRRACEHDSSKFGPSEFEAYEQAFPAFQKYAYGSREYEAEVRKIKPAVQHHYAANDHHPEFFANGIADMNLIQLLEMVCDWIAASERSHGGTDKSLKINKQRFGISDQLHRVIENTVEDLINRKQKGV
jgi:hypothetical protein